MLSIVDTAAQAVEQIEDGSTVMIGGFGVAGQPVELIDALTRDQASARRFVLSTLGPLADADEVLRHTLLTYVQCGFNTTRTAADLYAHRNTVERRVSRANELSTVKVEDNPTHVGAALLVLEIAPRIVLPMED